MFELSLHILDLVQNSISAGAKLVTIRIVIDRGADRLTIVIMDDGLRYGRGAAKTRNQSRSPLRAPRARWGWAFPCSSSAPRCAGATFPSVPSRARGTRLEASFQWSHMDLPPMGDLADTMRTILVGAPDKPEFRLEYQVDGRQFVFDTREVRQALGGFAVFPAPRYSTGSAGI